jgi:O-antigen chain-terminating bifunctional methyltransferase/kinase
MSDKLNHLIFDLPEVYQTIFGHPEWDKEAARNCNERLDKINSVYSVLSEKLGRPLNVLDLGCAQGFFSLSLASKGARVRGIDFLDKNIAVCQALADENQELDISFETGRIEDIVENISPRQYDLVIGLSVFHHLVHEHGKDEIKKLLLKLANSVHAIILELAVKEEPLYWASSLPEHAYQLIEHCHFYKKIADYETHLSNISRPMYVVSNDYLILDDYCDSFTSYTNVPYKTATAVHGESRRYYSNAHMVCKLYSFEKAGLSVYELARSKKELNQEINFLQSPPKNFSAPALLHSGVSATEGWVVMERLSGELLSDKISDGKDINLDAIFSGLLHQLVILEENDYFHDDIRPWNVLVTKTDDIYLIDFGSVSHDKKDCVWPDNIFLAFVLFVKEILVPQKISQGIFRSASLSPYNLPEKYANWIYAFWQNPVEAWSFKLLLDLFQKIDDLPDYQGEINGTGEWIKAQEKLLMNNQSHVYKLIVENDDSRLRIKQIENHIANGVEPDVKLLVEQTKHFDEKINVINERFSGVDENMKLFDAKVMALNNNVMQSVEQTEALITSYQELLNALEVKFESRFNESLNNVNEFKNSFESALDEIKLNFDSKELTDKKETIDEMPRDVLIEKINELQQHSHFLACENERLHHHIVAMNNSSSWRITKAWRKGGHYFRLMKTDSFQTLSKKFVKKISFKSIVFINQRPRLKIAIINNAKKMGLYNFLLRFYQRVNPPVVSHPQASVIVNEAMTPEHSEQSQLPELVKNIYFKLKR